MLSVRQLKWRPALDARPDGTKCLEERKAVKTIGEIRQSSDATLLSFQNLGASSVARLRDSLGVRAAKPTNRKEL
jgi:hypothetical protein